MQVRWDSGKKGCCRTGGCRKAGIQDRRMQEDRRNICRKRRMHERGVRIHDRKAAGQDRCR